MKKTNIILLIVCVILVGIAICFSLNKKIRETTSTNDSEIINQTETLNSASKKTEEINTGEESWPLRNENTSPQQKNTQDLGFIIAPLSTVELGSLDIFFYPDVWVGSGHYSGGFDELGDHVVFYSLKTEYIPATEGNYRWNGGYVNEDGKYYLISSSTGKKSAAPIPEKIIIGEADLSNGKALLISGLSQIENDFNMYPNEGEVAAILNIPNGLEKGGTFTADATISLESFKEILKNIVLIK